MRKIIAAVVAVSALAAPTIASAGSFQSTGILERVDTTTNTVLIRNGDAYKLPASVNASEFHAGQKVHVTWNTQTPVAVSKGESSLWLLTATGIQSAH